MNIESLISGLRASDKYIETIFMKGGCYRFHLFLKSLFPDSEAMINVLNDHVITAVNGQYFDITGEVDGKNYRPLSEADKQIVESWSFSRTMAISIGECQHCYEPILV